MDEIVAKLQSMKSWVAGMARAVFGRIAWLFGHVVGDVRWRAPAWMQWCGHKLAPAGRWAGRRAGWVLLGIVLAAVGWTATHPQLTAGAQNFLSMAQAFFSGGVRSRAADSINSEIVVISPGRTQIESEGKPQPAVLTFSASVAPLSRIGKEAQDVEISPAIAGRWTWAAANRLQFVPESDWPVDVKYRVTIGSKTLASHISLAKSSVEFVSPRFEAGIRSASFYQDPLQPNVRKAVFEVGFTHPVNTEDLEKRLALTADGLELKGGVARKFTISYDKLKLLATVQSEALPIPKRTASMILRVASGVTAQRGGSGTRDEITRAVAIPGVLGLEINELKQLIVTDESGEPESVLQITAGMPVHEKEMARAVSAWLLPVRDPASKAEKGIHVWDDADSVTDAVLKQSQAIALTAVAGEREIIETHAFRFKADPGRYLFVRVQKGLKSAGGFQMAAARDEIVVVKRFAPELAIMSSGSLLALSGEKKLPILVRDLPGVRIEIGRLLPQQLQHLITQTEGSMSKPEFYQGITPDHLTERFEKRLTFKLQPGKTHYQTVDFSEYLRSDASDRRGVFLLTVQGFDPKAGLPKDADPEPDKRREEEGEGEMEQNEDADRAALDPTSKRDRRLVIVTDLGIVAKQGVDGARDVFVQSIASGQPVAGAGVEIWARNGSVLASQSTDASGRAQLPSLSGFAREKTPVVMVVRKAGDLSFLPLTRSDRKLDVSRFDVGGVQSSGIPNQMRAYLFSDRGIYRPGDAMNFGVIVRASDWSRKLADLPVEAEVLDARGLVTRREKLKLGAGGMVEFTHKTDETSPTGNYTVNLNLARDAGSAAPGAQETPVLRLGSITVKVQEFLPDRMKVDVRLSSETAEGWVSPEDLRAKVNVQNLFGTPAPGRRVDAQFTLSPAFAAFRSHADYAFFDPHRAKESFTGDLSKTETDAQGAAEVELGLERYTAATYQLHLLVKAFEPEGGRSVAADTSVLVSDRPYLVGYKADGDLEYINRSGVRRVSLIAVDPRAKKIAVKGLKLGHVERKVLSVLVKQPNGLYKYESRTKETVLKEEAFALPVAGIALALPTQTPGNFAYVLRDADGLEVARVNYTVVGTGNVSRTLDRNAELQLSLNKKDFSPGDDIEISIRAPYTGAGLITIERDRVYAHQWFRAGATASVQKITLPKDFEGNGYVTVQFVRDLASNEIYTSPLSYGVAPFATSLANRTHAIRLQTPAVVKPGQTIKMRLESATPARAIVFAVDEGILQVARYQSPDPLKYFFQKRALEVGTQQTLDLILPEFRKLMNAAAPGGDAEGLLGKNLNPFKRKRDKPVVYWSGIVDIAGSREFSYTVPESFNGSLRVMAIAVSDSTTAVASAKTTVRGDLILLPNVPLAMTLGDEVEIGIGVANNAKGSGKDAPVTLSLAVAPGLEIVGEAQQTLKISERSEGVTIFRVKARAGEQAQLGSASVTFSAQWKDTRARLATDVSVRPASAYVTLVQTGVFRGKEELAAKGNMYPNFQRSEIAISSSPWAFTAGLIQYLNAYPHGCTEQVTSQTFPAVVLAGKGGLAQELLKPLQRTKSTERAAEAVAPDPQKVLERYIAIVRRRQQSDGGIAMWDGGASDIFATTYVVNLLVEARERKLVVPNDMLQHANAFLQSQIGRAVNADQEWHFRTYAAYLLTRQGIVVTAALTNLREHMRSRIAAATRVEEKDAWRRRIGAVYLAASYQMLKQEKLARELLQPAFENFLSEVDKPRVWYWNYYYDPLVHDATMIQIVALHFPAQLKQVPVPVWQRLANYVRDGYFNSQSASGILLAVEAYSRAVAAAASGKINVTAYDRQGQARPVTLPPLATLAKAALSADIVKLGLANPSDTPLYYSWAESGFEKSLPATAVSQGLEILREYLDAKGNVITEAQVGDEITVRVRVRATEQRSMVPQVALVDLLPGGLEPVLTTPSETDAPDQPLWRRRLGGRGSWNIEYADIREDRVVFYGNVTGQLVEVNYKVRATNAGNFVTPAAYGEAMYERRVFARSAGGSFKIKPAAK